MIDYYIHQIGNIENKKTYERLLSILRTKMICSRGYFEKHGIKFEYDNTSFELDIPDDKKWMYYEGDIHKDRVSLSDPQDRFIKKAIEKKDHQNFTCFDYDYIAFAVSRDVPLVVSDETKGLALGEVQVQDKIDSQYIVGLILPVTEEQLKDERYIQFIHAIDNICTESGFPLDIYNYEGLLISRKKTPNDDYSEKNIMHR